MDVSNSYDPESDLLPIVCSISSFITNCEEMFTFCSELAHANASVLASLLISGAEMDCLALNEELLEGSGAELGEAIKRSGRISKLLLNDDSGDDDYSERASAPELIQLAAFSASAALKQINICGIIIDDEHMTQLCDSFVKFTTLRSLKISNCDFSTPLLAKRIGKLRALVSLEIANVEHIEMQVAAMIDLPLITDLNLQNIEIDAEGLRQIRGLVVSGRIRKLNLANDNLKDKGISVIVGEIPASVRQRCELQELSLRGNGIGPDGARKIVELVARSPYLHYLDLGLNPIGMTAKEIIKKCAGPLEELDIDECELDTEKVVQLLASPACSALNVLEIEKNKMGNLGAKVVAQFLLDSGKRTLTKLFVDSNGITENGAVELAKGLAEAYALRDISIDENAIGPRGGAAVLDALATGSIKIMDMVSLKNCGIGDDGAEAVGRLIMHMRRITIYLDGNAIHEKGANVIADSINASACIIEALDLNMNPLGNDGVSYFFG